MPPKRILACAAAILRTATTGMRAATASGRSATLRAARNRRAASCGHATRNVEVAQLHLHIVGYERTHVALGIANLVLTLVSLHHELIAFAALRLLF